MMARFTPIETAPVPERALLVGVVLRSSAWPVERSLDELERLAQTAGAEVICRTTQRLDKPVPRSFIGSGKVEEIKSLIDTLSIDVVIFDDELTPAQQAHLEKTFGEPVKVIDRTALILDIFGLHARTREGRLQVQLAQLQYLLPRLRGMWSHLAKEQTRGGIGSRFGQGESQLEVDRRMIRDRISILKQELKALESRRAVQAKGRMDARTYRVALAGYTNAGKSSLLNRLTGSEVLAEDKLFATLDPTTRSYLLPGGRRVTITDTVGFIQKLPHGLVEAFKSTLSEVRNADLIVKVVDLSDENHERQAQAVDAVLAEIQADEIPACTVYNKIDLIDAELLDSMRRRDSDSVYFSALTGEGLDTLIERVVLEASWKDQLVSAVIPYSEGRMLALVHEQGQVLDERYEADGTHIVVKAPEHIVASLQPYVCS